MDTRKMILGLECRHALRFLSSRLLVAVMALGLFALPVMAQTGAAQSDKRRFDIPADTADRSLKLFSTQSGVDVVFTPETVASAKANAVKGDYTPLEAAQLLVAGTGLVVSQEGGNGAFLVNRGSDPNVQKVAPATASDRLNKVPADSAEIASLQKFVVTGTRMALDQLQTPISITSIDRSEFEQSGALTFQDTVAKVPGLQIGAQGGSFLRFATRGFRLTNDVLILVDGVPFRQVNGNSDLVNVPAGLIENIEYAKGPGSSVYGRDAVGGVVQIFTDAPRPDTTSGEVSVSGGSFGTLNGTVRAAVPTPNGVVNVDTGAGWSKGFQDRTASNQQFFKISDNEKVGSNLDVRTSFIDTHFFSYRSGAYPLINGEIAFGIPLSENLAVPDTVFKTNYQSITVTPTLTLGSEWKVTNIANYNRYLRYYTGGIQTDSNPGFNQSYTQDFSVQDILFEDLSATWTHKFGELKNVFLFGGTFEDGHYTDAAPTITNLPTFTPPNYGVPVTNAAFFPYGLKGATVDTWVYQPIYSGYAEEHVALDRFSLLLGVRYDSADQQYSQSTLTSAGKQTVTAMSPRASATYDFYKGAHDEVSAFASFSKSFKPLAPASSTSGGVVFFSLLQPEVADSYEAGLKGYDHDRRIFWQASAYQIEKVNAERFYRVNALTYLIAQDQQRVRGFEGEIEFRASDWLNFYVNYAYTDGINVNYVTATANLSDNQIAMNPRNTAGGGFNIRRGAWGLNVTSTFTGTRPLRDDIRNSMIMPSYWINKAVVSYVYKRTTFQAGVDNIGNVVYISDNLNGFNDGSAGTPRSFFGKVTYRF